MAKRSVVQSAVNEEMNGLRKAAILLLAIDRESAAELLKRLDRGQVEDVTREIAALSDIETRTRDKVVEEFYNLALARAYVEEGGLGYAKSLLEKSLPKDEAERVIEQIEHQVSKQPFSFLQKAETENLLTFIQDEHPQTIALILGHLPPHKASEILVGLPAAKQIEVVIRIANMEQTNPEVIKEVEKGLESRLSGIVSQKFQKVGGVDSVAEMLNLADRATEKAIMEALESEDPDLVEQIRRLMFVFEDITKFADKDIQAILKNVESAQWALALKGASDELKHKILNNMSKRASTLLIEEMEYLGPVRASNVEQVQQQIVDIIRRLEDMGELTVHAGDEEERFVQ